jgi:peptidase E
MKKIIFILAAFFLFSFAPAVSAHQPQIIYFKQGDINISQPEVSQAFYDELKGSPRNYFIDFSAQGGSASGGELYLNLLVPLNGSVDRRTTGKYSMNVFCQDVLIAVIDGSLTDWSEFYEEFGRDYYLKGPEFDQKVGAGKCKIEVYSADPLAGNQGKYVLAVGKKEQFDTKSLLNVYWQLPLLKIMFFKTSVLQFFLTPFGIAGIGAIGALLIFLAIINYLVALIKEAIKHRQAKTILLTSAGMQVKDEIIKLLQKPAYDITVAFITTAAKQESDTSFVDKDRIIMRELGFNVEEIDIEGKKERQLMKLLELKDIIFVEGGNSFYLLKVMRESGFEKVMKKLLKHGKVYIGASAGSIVVGKTIKTAGWPASPPASQRGEQGGGDADKNIVGLKNLKGLDFVPFDIFVHYRPEDKDVILQKLPKPRQRKKLKILTDDQALLIQGKNVILLGQGEEIII